jgi:NADH-quinone oxidoreductase subunit N
MPVNAAATLQFRDFYTLAPEVVLAVWGLVVLAADLGPYRRLSAEARKLAVGRVALLGAVVALIVSFLPLVCRFDMYGLQPWLNFARIDYLAEPDPILFFGALSSDVMVELFNVLIALLLVLVVWMSSAWSFTEDWGEYYALILWSAVGMMLLIASEELLTLFLTLETMTICLYLSTAFEKDKRRSAEGGLKYFVYGSVSSALFLFGLSLVYGMTGSTRIDAIHDVLAPLGGAGAGLEGNVAGAAALLLILVGFGFKIAAVPFHQWAPDAYEGAPAPVTAWVATGSKVASMVALMKVLLHALRPWSSGAAGVTSPGWIMVVAILAAASMTYGNFAALAQKNLKRMLAYSSIAHAGYMLVGVTAAGVSPRHAEAAGSVLFYLFVYAFANIGAFALAAWLARDRGSDEIEDLNGLGLTNPGLATCVLLLMLSLIGMPPLAGFFGKLYMFMEALDESTYYPARLTMIWLVALGLLNSVVSAFYYVRVLKAMFLRAPSGPALSPAPSSVAWTIVLATVVSIAFGIYPAPLVNLMKGVAVPMLGRTGTFGPRALAAPWSNSTPAPPPGPSPGQVAPGPMTPPAPQKAFTKKKTGKRANRPPDGGAGATTKPSNRPAVEAPAAKKE